MLFSTLDMIMNDGDHSYPTEDRQLLWRAEDLKDRLRELAESGAPYESGRRLTESDLRYTLPEHLCCIGHVETALLLAKRDLYRKFGIYLYEDEEQPDAEPEPEYADPRQITIPDWIGIKEQRQLAA